MGKEGEEVSLSERPGPLLLYFSAHWCPPCRGFTPKLVEFYSKLEKKYPEASIAFVSSDKDSKAWASYYQSMGENWLSLPYDARDQMEDKNVDGLKALATKQEKSETLFFYATEDAGIAEQVVRLCDIKPPKGEATLVLLDLDDDGAYYLTNQSDVS